MGREGECTIGPGWSIRVPNGTEAVLRTAAEDLSVFLAGRFGVRLSVRRGASGRGGKTVSLAVSPTPGAAADSFVITATGDSVSIRGADARGALYGTLHLEDLMAFRGSPSIPAGTIERKPLFPLRFGIPAGLNFSDRHLAFLAHTTVNATYIHYEPYMEQLLPSTILPRDGVNIRENRERVREINDIFSRAARWGIDGYLYVRGLRPFGKSLDQVGEEMKPFDPTVAGEIFEKFPDIRGSNLGVSLFPEGGGFFTNRSASRRRDVPPCFGSPTYRAFLRETCRNLFLRIPLLKGLVILTTDGTLWCDDSCPRCRGRRLIDRWIDYIRLLYESARSVRSDARFVLYIWGWPWKREERDRIIESLPADIVMLGTYTEGAKQDIRGQYRITTMNLDSSVAIPQPGEIFIGDLEASRRHGNPFVSLQGFGHNNDFYFVPYTPAPDSYIEQMSHLQARGASGWFTLDGSGLNPGINAEIARWSAWEKAEELPGILARIAERDCGKEAGQIVLQAFGEFGAAVRGIPSGSYALGPYLSRSVKYPFPLSDGILQFISDTSDFGFEIPLTYVLCEPEHITRTRGCFTTAAEGFGRGVSLLEQALVKAGGAGEKVAVRGILSVGRACLYHLQSSADFLEMLYSLRTDPADKEAQRRIIRKEIAVCSNYEGLLAETDIPLIGFSPYWGRVFWKEDLAKKREFLERELAKTKVG